jgi:SAM-dependent methyltransferase
MTAFDPAGVGQPLFARHLSGFYATLLLDLGRRTGALEAVLQAPEGIDAAGLADRCGLDPRNAAEWLAGMVAAGYLEQVRGVSRPTAGAIATFREGLPVDAHAVLEFARRIPELLPEVAAAMRSGAGIPHQRYVELAGDLLDRFHAPLYRQSLIGDWLAAVPGLVPALEAGAAVVELGCGSGQACRLLGQVFPRSRITGVDRDGGTFERGRKEIAGAGIGNVDLLEADPADREPVLAPGGADLVLLLDVLHHMGRPATVLDHAARLCRPGAWVVVVEPTVPPAGNAADPSAVVDYAGSLLYCLQDALAAGGPGYGAGVPGHEVARLQAGAGLRPAPAHHSRSGYSVFAANR